MKWLFPGVILLCVLVCAGPEGANAFSDVRKLKEWHGEELNRADFVIRYKFQDEYGVSWENASFEERRDFLMTWYTSLEDESKEESERELAAREYAKEMEEQRRDEKRTEQERLKEIEEADKEQKKQEEDEKRDFTKSVQEAKKQLQELHKSTH